MKNKRLKNPRRRFRRLLNYEHSHNIKRYPLSIIVQLALAKSGLLKGSLWSKQIRLSSFIPKKPIERTKFKQHLELLRKIPLFYKYELHVSSIFIFFIN